MDPMRPKRGLNLQPQKGPTEREQTPVGVYWTSAQNVVENRIGGQPKQHAIPFALVPFHVPVRDSLVAEAPQDCWYFLT